MKPKFKKGDKVEIVKVNPLADKSFNKYIGKQYTIQKVNDWDSCLLSIERGTWWSGEELKLVKSPCRKKPQKKAKNKVSGKSATLKTSTSSVIPNDCKSPRLKEGDTFIYTKEMDEAKKVSEWNNKVGEWIGKELTIEELDEDSYHIRDDGKGHVFMFNVIDDHLPDTSLFRPIPTKHLGLIEKGKESITDVRCFDATYKEVTKHPKRTWTKNVNIKSSDGIIISEGVIRIPTDQTICNCGKCGHTIKNLYFKIDRAKEIQNQLRKALDQHAQHFNK